MLSNFSEVVKQKSHDDALLNQIIWERVPRHVAIIMDGNGRWAAKRNKPRVSGHKAGVEAVRAAVDTGARLGLDALTLYAFSTENWKRPRLEVDALMKMLRHYLRAELEDLTSKGIRFQAIGRIEGLDKKVQKDLTMATERTKDNKGMVLSVALNYGGRTEIVDACREAMKKLIKEGKNAEDFSEDLISQNLYTRNLPELDLLIRTSGELRISNFLLWQNAYSEIYVTDTLWPDFRRKQMLEAVIEYQKRDRRFGGVKVKANGK